MSSEGSVTSTGSRIRQFGLYRTIDARTNEFLKSSRKRQIRQGCACAAISTAITVTVVVSVILVYEYSINSESNSNKKISLRPKWLGLMNESDPTKLDSKFTKKINFDRSTLKLLPVLLKALNKNRYLEKIIEDYASSSPPYEITDGTENYLKKNIFGDAKNWLKIPSSKIYTLDSKTTPLIYMKPSSQRLDYLSRVRKIRNYERMLNYFDKMINEKVTYSKPNQESKLDIETTENLLRLESTRKRLNKNKTSTEIDKSAYKNKYNAANNKTVTKITTTVKPSTEITNIPKTSTKITHSPKFSRNIINTSKLPRKSTNSNRLRKLRVETTDCKCPKNMGQLLNKLIVSLQELVPHVKNSNLTKGTCGTKVKSQLKTNKITTETTLSTTEPLLSELFSESTRQIPPIKEMVTEPSFNNMPAKLMPSIFKLEPRKNIIKINKGLKGDTLRFIKANVVEKITTQKSIMCPLTTIRTTNHLFSNTRASSTTSTSSTTTESTSMLIPEKPDNTKGENEYDKNIKSTTIITTEPNLNPTTTEQNQYSDNSKFNTSGNIKQQNIHLKNIASPTISDSTIDQGLHPFTEENTSKPTSTTIDSLLNYETDDETMLNNADQPTTQLQQPTTVTSRTTTELIKPFKFNDLFVENSSSAENLLDSVAIMPNVKRPIIPLFKEDEYEDYFISTPNKINEFDNFNEHSLESIKNKVVPPRPSSIESNKLKTTLRKGGLKSKIPHYHPVIKNKGVDSINMRKIANLVNLPNPVDDEHVVSKTTNLSENNNLIKKRKYTGLLSKITQPKISAENGIKSPSVVQSADQSTGENMGEEEFLEEWVKQTENVELPVAFNKSGINFNDYDTATSVNDGDNTKSQDSIKIASINSMIPPIRPIYLEIRRNNDWKPDEHADYDINLANNIFDLPNI